MRALLQRVSSAQVSVDDTVCGAVNRGFLVLLGVEPHDTHVQAEVLWNKIVGLRVFDDENHKMNLSLEQIKGEVLIVSQFTLYADCAHGRRPSFTKAASAPQARELYNYFCELAETSVKKGSVKAFATGIFGADMQVQLTNDGPVTIWLDTKELHA